MYVWHRFKNDTKQCKREISCRNIVNKKAKNRTFWKKSIWKLLIFLIFLLVFVASYWVFNYCCIYINRSHNAVEYAQVFKAKQKIQFLENNFVKYFFKCLKFFSLQHPPPPMSLHKKSSAQLVQAIGWLYETFNFVRSIISEMILLQND